MLGKHCSSDRQGSLLDPGREIENATTLGASTEIVAFLGAGKWCVPNESAVSEKRATSSLAAAAAAPSARTESSVLFCVRHGESSEWGRASGRRGPDRATNERGSFAAGRRRRRRRRGRRGQGATVRRAAGSAEAPESPEAVSSFVFLAGLCSCSRRTQGSSAGQTPCCSLLLVVGAAFLSSFLDLALTLRLSACIQPARRPSSRRTAAPCSSLLARQYLPSTNRPPRRRAEQQGKAGEKARKQLVKKSAGGRLCPRGS